MLGHLLTWRRNRREIFCLAFPSASGPRALGDLLQEHKFEWPGIALRVTHPDLNWDFDKLVKRAFSSTGPSCTTIGHTADIAQSWRAGMPLILLSTEDTSFDKGVLRMHWAEEAEKEAVCWTTKASMVCITSMKPAAVRSRL
ncbi:hypothetical protein WJX77_002093 [Trebouxia sp. C0004]